MFKAAVVYWGIPPSEFWSMHPREVWIMAEERKPPERVGSMLKTDFDHLKEVLDNAQSGNPINNADA